MNYSSNHSKNNNRQWVRCLAKADFHGDLNPNSRQLRFQQNTPLDVDVSRPPQNGWRWAVVSETGVSGWLPEWAVAPVEESIPPPPQQCPPPPPSSQFARSHNQRNALHRSADYVTPMQSISEQQINLGGDGFDQRHNDIMGGNLPRAETANGGVERRDDTVSSYQVGGKNPFEDVPDVGTTNSGWSSGFKKLGNVFQKQGKVGNISGGEIRTNPYTQKEQEPEWDGSEAPQVVMGDGRIAVVEDSGATNYYKNKASYQFATTQNQIAEQVSTTAKYASEQVSTTTSKLSQQLSKQLKQFNNKGSNSNNQQNQERQGGTSDNLVIAVDANGAQQQQPQQGSSSSPSKKGGMFGTFKMPKMPKMPTRMERREQNQTKTAYCDANGNEQSIVEKGRRSTTSLNIYY